MPAWLLKAWEWTKRNWKWLLFPIGILIYIAGRARPRDITMVSPELIGHSEVERELNAEADAKKQVVEKKTEEQLAGIEAQREASLAAEQQQQLDAAAAIENDPQAVNDFLKQVGKDIRK